jgi:hypothetical protein
MSSTPTFDACVMEVLSDREHERWSGWQEYMHSLCERHADGSLTIPADSVKHWERQIATYYAGLTPREKESDREEVRKNLAAMWKILPPHIAPIVEAMLVAYRENPRGEYYMTLTPEKLVKMLQQNISEVALALEFDNDVEGKCGDVANYVGFIIRLYLSQNAADGAQ